MHTDEYEISVGREITLCRKVIDRLTNALRVREKRYGMATEEFLAAFQEGRFPEPDRDLLSWNEDSRELQSWRQKLVEYEDAFQMLKQM
jgi:hypothetical protein